MTDVGEIVSEITDDIRRIIAGEIELAKAELLPSARRAGIGAGLFGGAGYLAMTAIHLLLLTGAGGIALLYLLTGMDLLPAIVLGALTTSVLLLVLAGILFAVGKSQVAKAAEGPQRALNNALDSLAPRRRAPQATAAAPPDSGGRPDGSGSLNPTSRT